MIIAIDGPVAAGKGTLARRLASALGYAYLDTGAMYRAVAARLLREGYVPEDVEAAKNIARSLRMEDLTVPELRREDVGEAASKVASIGDVRQILLDFQRNFAAHPPDGAAGAVLDGRDIGTVVCPGADLKIYITASPEIRAHRRYMELRARGEDVDEATVLADLRRRDERDSTRAAAPLRPAEDAHLLDTSNLDIETAFRAIREIVTRHCGHWPGQAG